jgi:hypothetical protein
LSLLASLAATSLSGAGLAQDRQNMSFDDTVKFIDSKLSPIERNQKVGYRFTASTICVAYWGNDSIRTELPFGVLDRIGVDTGSDASVICPAPKPGRGRVRPPGCITVQYRSETGWERYDTARFARLFAGDDATSAEVQGALLRLIGMCGGGS